MKRVLATGIALGYPPAGNWAWRRWQSCPGMTFPHVALADQAYCVGRPGQLVSMSEPADGGLKPRPTPSIPAMGFGRECALLTVRHLWHYFRPFPEAIEAIGGGAGGADGPNGDQVPGTGAPNGCRNRYSAEKSATHCCSRPQQGRGQGAGGGARLAGLELAQGRQAAFSDGV